MSIQIFLRHFHQNSFSGEWAQSSLLFYLSSKFIINWLWFHLESWYQSWGQLFLNFSCPFLIQPLGIRKIVRIQIILVKASNVMPTDFELISKALKTRKSVPLAPKQAWFKIININIYEKTWIAITTKPGIVVKRESWKFVVKRVNPPAPRAGIATNKVSGYEVANIKQTRPFKV